MAPGVAPAARQAAACPNSCQPADSTVMAKTPSSSPGESKACRVADPRPLSNSTHAQTARKPSITGTTTSGEKSQAKGPVIRRVTAGSETTTLSLRPSSGEAFCASGAAPDSSASSPSGATFCSSR